MSKQFYFKQFSLVNKVEWSQLLLCITNNSIKHQSFIYTQLNVKIVQFSISRQFKCKNSSISAETQSMYSTAPADWARVGRVLVFCRDAVGVFYSPSRLGPHWVSFSLLQRCSRCIVQPQPTRPALGEF